MYERLRQDERGVASIEFAFIALALGVAMLNVADLGLYMYSRMEVDNAAQMGAQAAWKTCDGATKLPATTRCAGLSAAVTAAVQSTSLGTKVATASGYPAEGYYCVGSDNRLQRVSDVSSKPANCAAAGTPALKPSDYVQVRVSYAYAPLFPGITVTSRLSSQIVRTSIMRLD
jgi:Flp pilus assembly protein TadG